MNVARILAKKERFERTQNGGETRGKKTLTESGDGFVGFDVDKRPIEVPFDDCGFKANDFQWLLSCSPIARVRDYHLLHNEILRQGKIIFGIARLD
jgi:hypothetical protein